jgi:hypothetical protein
MGCCENGLNAPSRSSSTRRNNISNCPARCPPSSRFLARMICWLSRRRAFARESSTVHRSHTAQAVTITTEYTQRIHRQRSTRSRSLRSCSACRSCKRTVAGYFRSRARPRSPTRRARARPQIKSPATGTRGWKFPASRTPDSYAIHEQHGAPIGRDCKTMFRQSSLPDSTMRARPRWRRSARSVCASC